MSPRSRATPRAPPCVATPTPVAPLPPHGNGVPRVRHSPHQSSPGTRLARIRRTGARSGVSLHWWGWANGLRYPPLFIRSPGSGEISVPGSFFLSPRLACSCGGRSRACQGRGGGSCGGGDGAAQPSLSRVGLSGRERTLQESPQQYSPFIHPYRQASQARPSRSQALASSSEPEEKTTLRGASRRRILSRSAEAPDRPSDASRVAEEVELSGRLSSPRYISSLESCSRATCRVHAPRAARALLFEHPTAGGRTTWDKPGTPVSATGRLWPAAIHSE